MVNHINKYASAQEIQDALDNGTLANPYVAMTTAGTLDYNTLEPTPPGPATMGVWTGKSFKVTEEDKEEYWALPVKIGVLNDVYMDGNQDSPEVMLTYYPMSDVWNMEFYSAIASAPVVHDFEEMEPTWSTGVMTEPDESNSEIIVEFDGVDTFTFTIADGFLTAINPEYPAGE